MLFLTLPCQVSLFNYFGDSCHSTQSSLSGLNEILKYGLVATGARGRLLKATPTMSLLELEERAEYSGGDV